jgi:3-deoxy-manno-octulosonate cytidylyltransferase (CMP-KDO synthetase)
MKKEKVVCIIPARYGSERLPGKVLYQLGGKSILERVYDRARKIKVFSGIYIATDSKNIIEAAEKFGAKTILTSSGCRSGSDRVAEAAKEIDASIIVNIQADEPYLPAEAVEKSLEILMNDKKLKITTAATKIKKKEELYDTNTVKIAMDKDSYALYFSRSIIPYPRTYFCPDNLARLKKIAFYKHIGVYLFRKQFLLEFSKMQNSFLESIEKLEQLRILEQGYRIKVAVISKDSPCVDTLEDIEKLKKRN